MLNNKFNINEKDIEILLSTSSLVFFEYDIKNDKFLYISNMASEVFGYDLGYWDNINSCLKLIHPNDRLETEIFIQKQIKNMQDFEISYRVITNSGTIKWLSQHAKVIYENEERIFLKGYFIDISDCTNKEQNLKFMTSLLDYSNDAVFIAEEETARLIYVNDRAAINLGYSKDELLQMKVYEVDSDYNNSELWNEQLEELKIFKDNTIITNHICKDSRKIPVEVNIKYRIEEGKGYIIGIARDITDRLKKEKELREKEYFSQLILSSLSEGVVIHDSTGAITECNKSAEKILGLTRDQILGKTSESPDWKTVYEDLTEFPSHNHPAMISLKRKQATKNTILGVISGDKKLKWININSVPILHENRKDIKSVVVTFLDITDLKNSNIEQKSLIQQLELERDRSQKYFDIAGVMILVLDLDGKIQSINKKGCKILGEEEKDLLGLNWIDTFVPGNFKKEILGIFKHIISNPKNEDYTYVEHEIVLSNGVKRKIAWYISILYDKQGKIEGILSSGEDITVKKSAIDAIYEREERYRTLIANIPGVVYRCNYDENWTMMFITDTIKELTGYPASDFLLNRERSFDSIIHPDDRELVLNEISDTIQKQSYYTIKYRVIHSDQSVRWVLEKGQANYDKDGNVLWLDGVILDNTQQKLAEEALLTSENQFRILFENLLDSLVIFKAIFDTDNTVIDFELVNMNNNFEQIIQLNKKDLIGKTLSELFPDITYKYKDIHDLLEKVILENITKEFEYYLAEFNKWYRISVFSPQKNQLAIIFSDITKKIENEKQIKILSQAVEQSANAVVITNIDGDIEYVNPKFSQLTEYSSKEAIGKKPSILKGEDNSKEKYKTLWDTITSGKEWNGEFLNKKKSGELYWELASINPIFNENNEIIHFLAIKEDITERKKAEQELNKYKIHLEDLVEERTEELEEITEELQTANEELQKLILKEQELSKLKDEFTSNINHELRSPLTAIIMSTNYLKKRLAKLSLDQIEERLNRIDISSKKLLNLVNELLDFSKLKAGKIDCNLESIQLLEICKQIKESYTDLFNAKNLDFQMNIDENIVLQNDKEHIYKVLNNLISNSCKFTENGYIQITAKNEDNDKVLICIEDTGCGIADENLNIIFDRFTQGKIQNNKAPGTGIGLHMVKALTEKHGGTVEVESELNKGTKFKILIPKISEWSKI